MKPSYTVILTLLYVVAMGLMIGPVWWWAIFGMSSEIGTAWTVTDSILIPVLRHVPRVDFRAISRNLIGYPHVS